MPDSSRAYLRPEQRYQLLEPLPSLKEIAATSVAQVQFLDCKPLQLSPLEVNADSVMTMEVPAIAKRISAESSFPAALPAIRD